MAGRYVPTLAQPECMKIEEKEFEVQFLDQKVLDLKERKNRAVLLRKEIEDGWIQRRNTSQIKRFAIDLADMFEEEIRTLGKKSRI